MKGIVVSFAAVISAALGGCGTVERLWSGGSTEQKRVRPGVTEYACEGNRKLLVRFDAAAKSAWVILPEREFRLDAAPSASGTRYSNGRSTLTVNGEELALEEAATTTHANCKRSTGG